MKDNITVIFITEYFETIYYAIYILTEWKIIGVYSLLEISNFQFISLL